MTAAETFVDHALGLAWEAVPAEARTAAATFLHDTLAVGAAGVRAPHADAILTAARGWGSHGDALVLGRPGVRLAPAQAAFVNAFQMHAQEFDCVHEPAVLHPMATIGAAILAEPGRHTGPEVLAAIVVGTDVSAGLGVAATTPLKFFRPATSGIFGAIAAVCRLRGMTHDQALDAFGYGLAFASGTMQAHEEGKPALPVQIANAARGAVMAVDLAQGGLPGPRRSLDGTFGYLPLFETGFDLAPVLASLGTTFRIAEVSWKPFPTGRAGHGGITAIQALMADQGATTHNLQSLTYAAPPLIGRLVGRPVVEAMTPAHARLCLPYLAAVTLTRGTVGLDDFTPASLADPALLALAARVQVVDNGNPDPAAFVPATATAKLSDGREAQVTIDAQLGSPARPLTREQHLEKARACLAYAGLEHAHLPLADLMARFEALPDAAPAFRLAAGDPP